LPCLGLFGLALSPVKPNAGTNGQILGENRMNESNACSFGFA